MNVPGIIRVPPPKLEDVIDEHEYVLTWYHCQLKVDEEEKDTNCIHADGFPDCKTCDYQIKINEEIQKTYEECMKWNREHGTSIVTHERRTEP